jgi:antitoxin (DNA-binding transcriptional repressor) of toxin-antitoxin stability system
MRTATVADLRNNFRLISTWLEHGEQVEITKRGKEYAVIQLKRKIAPKKPMPDVEARCRRTCAGLPVLTDAQTQEIRDWEDNEP